MINALSFRKVLPYYATKDNGNTCISMQKTLAKQQQQQLMYTQWVHLWHITMTVYKYGRHASSSKVRFKHFDRPLVADCSVFDKPCLFRVIGWDVEPSTHQKKLYNVENGGSLNAIMQKKKKSPLGRLGILLKYNLKFCSTPCWSAQFRYENQPDRRAWAYFSCEGLCQRLKSAIWDAQTDGCQPLIAEDTWQNAGMEG